MSLSSLLKKIGAKHYHFLLFAVSSKKIAYGIHLFSVKDDDIFFDHTEKSLSLIKQFDSEAFGKVQKYLTRIAHLGQGDNKYDFRAKTFYVGDYFPNDVCFFASFIVHEAKHAELHSNGMKYETKEEMEEQETICTTAQHTFLKLLIDKNPNLDEEDKSKYLEEYAAWFKEGLKGRWWERTL